MQPRTRYTACVCDRIDQGGETNDVRNVEAWNRVRWRRSGEVLVRFGFEQTRVQVGDRGCSLETGEVGERWKSAEQGGGKITRSSTLLALRRVRRSRQSPS